MNYEQMSFFFSFLLFQVKEMASHDVSAEPTYLILPPAKSSPASMRIPVCQYPRRLGLAMSGTCNVDTADSAWFQASINLICPTQTMCIQPVTCSAPVERNGVVFEGIQARREGVVEK